MVPGDDEVLDGWIDEEWEEIGDDGMTVDQPLTDSSFFPGFMVPEKKTIYLPSSIGAHKCSSLGLQKLALTELSLREGQANDALQAIRLAIAEKSFYFRKHLRLSRSKTEKTRSWDAIHTVGRRIQHQRHIYRQARHAMLNLGLSEAQLLSTYPELRDEDLHTSTAIQEPNSRGQRSKQLSWIWKASGLHVSNEPTLLNERTSTPFNSYHHLTLKACSISSQLAPSEIHS
jgi:hypothetical protein